MLVFTLMTLMTTAHVLMKALACSVMLRLSAMWFWMYLGADTGIYLLYKFVRGDLRYQLNLRGLLGWTVTFITRIVIKIIVDFTLIVHFRHSFELGGAYWSFNVFCNQAFCFISVLLYSKSGGLRGTPIARENFSPSRLGVIMKEITPVFWVTNVDFPLSLLRLGSRGVSNRCLPLRLVGLLE
jgi:hypothetical protein